MNTFKHNFQAFYTIIFAVFNLSLWILLLFFKIFFGYKIETTCQYIEFVIDFINIFLGYHIYQKTKHNENKIPIYFVISMVFSFLTDAWYYIVYPLKLNTYFDLFTVIRYSWYVLIIMFVLRLLIKYALSLKQSLITFSSLFVISIIILAFYSFDYIKYIFYPYYSIDLLADLVIFNLVILWVIYSKNKYALLLSSGYVIGIASQFMFTSSYMSKTLNLLDYCELLWLIGITIMSLGMLNIIRTKVYTVSDWFNNSMALKSRLTFLIFNMVIISFIVSCILLQKLGVINKALTVLLPSIAMIYSLCAVILSMLISNYFERPFKQLQKNINYLSQNNKGKINSNFSINEFVFLQKFIVQAFADRQEKEAQQLELERIQAQTAIKEEQLKLENETNKAKALQLQNDALQATAEEQEKFKKVVRQMAHDITSPISSIDTIVGKLSSNVPEDDRVTLRHAVERIAGISQKLLSKYDNRDIISDDQEDLLLSLALIQIMNEKREEYRDTKINFGLNILQDANFTFIKINSGMFKRMISNLVNNAADAVKNRDNGKVTLQLGINADKVVIIIMDNGSGIPQHIQDKFSQGIEVTEGKGEAGHGIGLTQVRDTIKTGNGKFDVYGNEKYGTTITIWFPVVATPYWLTTEIKLTKDDTVIILDDDNSIHGAWDSNFKTILEKIPTLKIKHFTQGTEVIIYLNSLTDQEQQDIFLLTDYELLGQGINGLDVVAQTGLDRAILVTSYSASPNIQAEVIKAGIKLLPKELAGAAKIQVDKKIPKWSKKVDMLWLEDQAWLVNDLVKRFYSHLTIDIYNDPVSFMEDINHYPLDTRIILDTYYEDQNRVPYVIDGFNLAEKLHTLGYTKLILFGGEDPEGHIAPKYLTVVPKKDQEATKHLDKI